MLVLNKVIAAISKDESFILEFLDNFYKKNKIGCLSLGIFKNFDWEMEVLTENNLIMKTEYGWFISPLGKDCLELHSKFVLL